MIALLLALALQGAEARPAPELTPGLRRVAITRELACSTAWGRDRRHVTVAMRRHVFASYGIRWADRAQYEVDHLIPRSLGGADDVLNLWPQPYAGSRGARKKDRLEIALSKAVCRGTVTLARAQDAIAADWVAAYRLYVGRMD